MQKQLPLSVFVFIDSFVVSALQDAGGYAISRQNNLELHLGYHTCWLSYFTLVCLRWERTVSRAGGRAVYGHVITKFSRMGRLLHFLTHGAPLARFARESSAIIASRDQPRPINNREIKHHVYGKWQTWICTTWPSFPFTYRLLFIIATRKSVDSLQFYP